MEGFFESLFSTLSETIVGYITQFVDLLFGGEFNSARGGVRGGKAFPGNCG